MSRRTALLAWAIPVHAFLARQFEQRRLPVFRRPSRSLAEAAKLLSCGYAHFRVQPDVARQ
jgi:hypothetical protein